MKKAPTKSTRHPNIEEALTTYYKMVAIDYSDEGYRAELVPMYEYRNDKTYYRGGYKPTVQQALDSLEVCI